jgi:hypothetical protein
VAIRLAVVDDQIEAGAPASAEATNLHQLRARSKRERAETSGNSTCFPDFLTWNRAWRIQLHSRVHDRALRVRARAPEFDKLGVQLIGLSIDSVNSHIAWIRNIEQRFGVKVRYPLIADLDMKVAQKYGHPEAATTTTVRCVFVVDDEGMLKAKAWPPRWKPGDKLIQRPRLR